MQFKHLLQYSVLAAALTAGAAQAQNVVLYSSNNTETIETALDAVKQKSPKLNVQPVTGGTGTMMKRIEAEAQNPRGDLFWSGGFGTLALTASTCSPTVRPTWTRSPPNSAVRTICGWAPTCTSW